MQPFRHHSEFYRYAARDPRVNYAVGRRQSSAMLPAEGAGMQPMIFNLLCWLTSKDVINASLQLLLFLATCGLIWVGFKQRDAARAQAKAAETQATAANEQVIAAKEQVAASTVQLAEVLSQGIAARRPFLIVEAGPSVNGRTQAILKNQGPGIAFQASWEIRI